MKGVDITRSSPLIGPNVPVHGLVVDIETGRVEWLVNGYEKLSTVTSKWNEAMRSAGQTVDAFKNLTDFKIGEIKFPETKIGEIVTRVEQWAEEKVHDLEVKPPPPRPAEPPAGPPPKLPLPPPLRPRISLRRGPK